MVGALILIGLLLLIIAFDLAVWRWGVDTTDAVSGLEHSDTLHTELIQPLTLSEEAGNP